MLGQQPDRIESPVLQRAEDGDWYHGMVTPSGVGIREWWICGTAVRREFYVPAGAEIVLVVSRVPVRGAVRRARNRHQSMLFNALEYAIEAAWHPHQPDTLWWWVEIVDKGR